MTGAERLDTAELTALLDGVRHAAVRAGEAIVAIARGGAAAWEAQSKPDESPLTAADLAANAIICEALHELDPHTLVISEETACELETLPRRFWLVDPLDGTREFVAGNGEYTVNVALVEDGVPVLGVVHAPARGVTYLLPRRGITRIGTGDIRTADAHESEQRGTAAHTIHARADGPLTVVASRSHPSPSLAAFLAALPPHDAVELGSSLKLCLVADGTAQLYPRLGPTCWWDTAAAHAVVLESGAQITTLEGMPLAVRRARHAQPAVRVLVVAARGLGRRGARDRMTAADIQLDVIAPDDYARDVLPRSQTLWAGARTFEEYVAEFLATANSGWGKRRFRTLGLRVNGELVASCKRYERTLRCGDRSYKAAGIGAVFTPDELRGRGYATALLGAFLDAERDAGTDLAYLFSDIRPAFYERLGFVALPSRTITLRADMLLTERVEVVVLGDDDAAAVRRVFGALDARRPFAFARTPLDWEWQRLRAASREHARRVRAPRRAARPRARRLRDRPPRPGRRRVRARRARLRARRRRPLHRAAAARRRRRPAHDPRLAPAGRRARSAPARRRPRARRRDRDADPAQRGVPRRVPRPRHRTARERRPVLEHRPHLAVQLGTAHGAVRRYTTSTPTSCGPS